MRALAELLPRAADYAGLSRSWPRDLPAGVTVGIVALPLALAFSVATGVGAVVGLVTAVIAGAVAAIFGGSHLQVSGPTGAMTVVLIPLVSKHGPGVMYPVAVLAGLMIVIAAFARLGRLLAYIPWPLVEGFTVGIAVVIAAQEVPNALGIAKPHLDNAAGAAAIAVGRFAAAPALGRRRPARAHRRADRGPAATASLDAGQPDRDLRRDHGGRRHRYDTGRLGTLPSRLPSPSFPELRQRGALLGPALIVAFLAALESLLSAQVADGMSDRPRYGPDRELFGQGLANIASGIGGGMPATGAIARTAVNARAGAHTRVAALTHAVVLAVIVYTASSLVGRIPLVALAGVLLVTAYGWSSGTTSRAILTSTRSDAVVFVVTAVGTVAFDLVHAVAAGLVVAGVLALAHLANTAHAVPEPLAVRASTTTRNTRC